MKKFLSLFFKSPDDDNRPKSVLLYIVFFASIFTCFCFFNFFTSLLVDGGSVIIPGLALCVTVAAILPVVLWKRLRRWLMILLSVCVCFYTVTFCIFCGVVLSFSSDAETVTDTSDPLLIVYGCRTYADGPSKMLKRRLDAAYELLVKYPDSLCIVTGGQGPSEPVTEAFAMERYLTELGIDEERIIAEDRASSTKENIAFSREIIEEYSLGDRTVISVSENYHLMRISLLAERNDFETEVYAADYTLDFRFLSSLTREYLSYIKLTVLGTEL